MSVIATGYRDGEPCTVELSYIDPHGHLLEREAALAFARMAARCKHDTGEELIVNSAFRSHEQQAKLWREYERKLSVWEKRKHLPKPLRPSKPGKSRHESGVAVDIDLYDDSGKERSAKAWLDEHAAEYGFVRTVAAEHWHFEYTGAKA